MIDLDVIDNAAIDIIERSSPDDAWMKRLQADIEAVPLMLIPLRRDVLAGDGEQARRDELPERWDEAFEGRH